MSDGSTTRQSRQARPGFEGLEDRRLLSGAHLNRHGKWENLIIHDKDLSRFLIQKNDPVPVTDRRISYTAPGGGRVTVTLYGRGTLAGSFIDPDGALNLRFAGTDSNTGIVGTVHGGDGRAPVRSVLHATLPPNSVSGIGSTVLRVVNLRNFDLVDGGRINLTGGVKSFFLNSTGRDTQINLRELPEELINNASTSNVNRNGVTFGFALDVLGAQTLTSTSGTFVAGASTLPNAPSANREGDIPTPPGLVAVIQQVNGPSRAEQDIGEPEFFGYDPVTNELIGFRVAQTTAGLVANPSLRIAGAIPGGAPAGVSPGVSLGRNQGNLVVLVNDGARVYAYDPLDGSAVGSFALNSPSKDLTGWSRLGTVDSFTVVGKAGSGADNGEVVLINVTESLAAGVVRPLGDAFPAVPFTPGREFGLSGGFGSYAGSSTLYAAGGAHFDTFLPTQYQLGALSLTPTSNTSTATPPTTTYNFRESARTRITGIPATDNTTPTGGTAASPNSALGSLDQLLALITNLVPASANNPQAFNEVSLINPQSFARTGVIRLFNPNQLSGLSAAFYPDLAGAALIDVQGNVQSFRALSTRGMVFNDLGTLNFVKVHRADDTTIIGYPVTHVEIGTRNNTEVITTSRPDHIGTRGGVTIQPNRRPTGPLSLP